MTADNEPDDATARGDDDRSVDPHERDDDPGPRPDDDREREEQVVGLGVDADDREVPEPNEPA